MEGCLEYLANRFSFFKTREDYMQYVIIDEVVVLNC